ncbi:oligopeptidase B Serine peptidase. MEROPS family S09A [Nocardioides scoriae]|uniref:Oligopeptidase B Serine peptidase. MEROPS family S09A n=1 Tax=Nocardioides scoriae TaxID=642780 RepID=A0A1H1M5Z8_9ACTN|nr:S9 family peptidase [Nocardioides scoriae]SDR82208.1 oligopeptidase B Serine peptidase. MEROPS family S09A [Nocardioides scoriae]
MDPLQPPTTPPTAPTRRTTRVLHGRERHDDYEWLRAKEDPEVLALLEAENAWTRHATAHLAELRDQVVEEIRSRTRETDLSVPTRRGGHWYYGRSFVGREYGASCRVPVAGPDDWTPPMPVETDPGQPALPGEQVLLDLDALAEGHEFFSLGASKVSPDEQLLAWATDTVGDERYEVRVTDLRTGELLPDRLTGTAGSLTWERDGSALYYVTVDHAWRADRVWRHVLGTEQAADEVVLHEPDERFRVGVGRTRSDRFLVVVCHSKTTAEYHVLDTERPELGLRLFQGRREDLDYSLEHAVIAGEDRFVITHNHDGPDFAVATSPVDPTPVEAWEPLVPHDPSVRIEDVDAFATHLVVSQRSGGLTNLRVLTLGDAGVEDDYLVDFDRETYTVGLRGNHEFDTPVVRLGFGSLSVPSSVYDHDVATRELRLLRRTPVLGGYDPDDYEEHRLWVPAPDGEQVPVSLVVRRDARARGPVPTLLYGYGSYEASMDPGFSIARLSLLERGVAFAIAHVRGGGELGRRWYDDGKMEHKKNTFTDFIACARFLRDEGWASRLVAEGGSAGGLLMGAVATQAPELFDGVVAGVPFVDNLTTMLDASLPLTVTEYDEWGNPEADPEVYDYIASYAPYDNVTSGPYPPILAETSLNDTRVLYVEPAKWVSRLRASAPDRRPDVLLRTEMAAGHGGVSGRYQAWKDRAFTLAWILDRLGLA